MKAPEDTQCQVSWDAGPGFSPGPVFRNAHVQTILASIKLRRPWVRKRAAAMLAASRPELLDCGEGVRLGGFYSENPSPNGDLAVLIHGWEGSAGSTYLMSAAAFLFDRGLNVFRLNLRDHGDTHHLNPGLFHSCRVDEVAGAVGTLARRHRPRRLFLVGFSLGGSFALRTALRAPGRGIALSRVVAISPVLDPHHTMEALERHGFGIYQRYFMKKWRRSLRAKHRCFPRRYDIRDIDDYPTLREMTAHLIPRFSEFPDIDTYLSGYRIIGPALDGLAVPCHIIASRDDPVNPAADLDRLSDSPFISRTIAPFGGHCGFFNGFRIWAEEETARILIHPDGRSAEERMTHA